MHWVHVISYILLFSSRATRPYPKSDIQGPITINLKRTQDAGTSEEISLGIRSASDLSAVGAVLEITAMVFPCRVPHAPSVASAAPSNSATAHSVNVDVVPTAVTHVLIFVSGSAPAPCLLFELRAFAQASPISAAAVSRVYGLNPAEKGRTTQVDEGGAAGGGKRSQRALRTALVECVMVLHAELRTTEWDRAEDVRGALGCDLHSVGNGWRCVWLGMRPDACETEREFWKVAKSIMNPKRILSGFSAETLKNVFVARMNPVVPVPESFDKERLSYNQALAAAIGEVKAVGGDRFTSRF
ncbi:hypothetical protein B0H19DRAFT_1071240 [Mycena capillaripes]|nr:hypothetical protein B0H19DRAFT_1071240 [Mycena capillaripes]